MNSERHRIRVTRRKVQGVGKFCLRTWSCKEEIPGWFEQALRGAKPTLGFGVVDPLELQLTSRNLLSVSLLEGRTLLERFQAQKAPFEENSARAVLGQLCYGLNRIHAVLDGAHGGIAPFNIHQSPPGVMQFWSVPTARMEMSLGTEHENWEPYRSPQVKEGTAPTVADDIYALGIIFARCLFHPDHDRFLNWCRDRSVPPSLESSSGEVLRRCTEFDPFNRYGSVVELAEALGPDYSLKGLDIPGARAHDKLGVKAYLGGRIQNALEHWNDSVKKDGMNVAAVSNRGVGAARLNRWDQAISDLSSARGIGYHPLVETNLGYCFLRVGHQDVAHTQLRKAQALCPSSGLAASYLAELALEQGHHKVALDHLLKSLAINSSCRRTRLLMASLMDRMGDIREADCHRRMAERLPEPLPLSENLITEQNAVPWTFLSKSGQGSIVDRYNLRAP